VRTLIPRDGFALPAGYDSWSPGREALKHGLPWITPKSLMFLNGLLIAPEAALDIGCGGSTIFFGARCQRVVGIEIDVMGDWKESLEQALVEQDLDNVNILFKKTQNEVVNEIKKLDEASFDVISIDTYFPYNRELFLLTAISKLKPKGILVLDNYLDGALWNASCAYTPEKFQEVYNMPDHIVEDFGYDGPKAWGGRYTRLVYPKLAYD
jgi:predicted O-methyltransferase YrrM